MKKALKKIDIYLIIVFVSALVISSAYARSIKKGNYDSKPKINIEQLEKQIHELINKERQKNGLSSLEWNKQLQMIARKHSQDMAVRKYFSHESPEEQNFFSRYSKNGFSCKIRIGDIIHTGAENISQDNLYIAVVYKNKVPFYKWNSQSAIAKSVVQRWMKSRGHRENILKPYWKTQGIGVAISEDGKVYITENFC